VRFALIYLIMQMPVMIHLSVIALLVVATSGSSPALRKSPLHSQQLATLGGTQAGETEVARAQLCSQHGFKATERTGCVTFMTQACHEGKAALNGQVACAQFFQEEQPASEHPLDVQKGPNYDSKQANKAAQPDLKESDGREGLADKAAQLKPEYTDKQVQKDWQRGPEYKSKTAQKAAHVAAEQDKAKQRDREGIVDKASELKPEYSEKQVQKDWQRGPNYKSKRAQKAQQPDLKESEEDDREGLADKAAKVIKAEPEEKDSQPAHYLGPIADYIDDALGNAGERKPIKSKKAQKEEASDEQKAPVEPHKQAKKAPKKLAVKYSVPEEKEVASVPGCRNFPKGWADAKDNDCEDYAEGEWCTRHGGYGDAWLDEWGTFEDVANQGKTAKQVCCVCGGGLRKDEEEGGYDREEPKHIMTAKERQTALANGALQSQGYSGELVGPYEDKTTMTSDWGREFGPGAGHRDIKSICAANPENQWCELHGYYDKEKPKSSSSPVRMMAVFAALLLACLH